MNQYALITGASRGIGRATATIFAKAGYNLYLTCHQNQAQLLSLARTLEKKYEISCRIFTGDIGNYSFVKEMFNDISSLDVLVNNAGVAWLGLLTDMKPEEWRQLMSVNLDSLYNTCSLAVPLMLHKHSGRIINVSSVWGSVGASTEVAYSASKGGVNAFTKALAKELAPSGISINAVSCGVIDTDMNRKHLSVSDIEALEQEIPYGRMGKPEEVASVILDIAGSTTYMTGQIITIDGGWY